MKIYAENINHETYRRANFVINWVYLHGILEEINGYDIVCSSKRNSFTDGIHDVDVIFADGSCHKAKMYLWHDTGVFNKQRGLIVDPSDTESVEYAKQCLENKTDCL